MILKLQNSATKLRSILGPFLILGGVVLLFSFLISFKDVMESRSNLGQSASWVEAWKETDLANVKAYVSSANFKIILVQTVIVALGALGMTMIIVSGGIDLSFGSGIALTSVVTGVMLHQRIPMTWVVIGPLAVGALIGCLNGSLIAGFRMAPFIVTLGMLGIARGAAKWMAGNQAVNFPESTLSSLMASGSGIPPGVWIVVALAILMSVLMKRTIFGRYMFAIGSNEATARLCGIRTRRMKVGIYTLAGFFVGLAGLMQTSRLQQGDPTSAIGLELDIIAAVVIGGASLSGGTGSILGSMIGALTMAALRTGSQYMDWPNYMQEIIIGVLIILAVGLDRWRQSRAVVARPTRSPC